MHTDSSARPPPAVAEPGASSLRPSTWLYMELDLKKLKPSSVSPGQLRRGNSASSRAHSRRIWYSPEQARQPRILGTPKSAHHFWLTSLSAFADPDFHRQNLVLQPFVRMLSFGAHQVAKSENPIRVQGSSPSSAGAWCVRVLEALRLLEPSCCTRTGSSGALSTRTQLQHCTSCSLRPSCRLRRRHFRQNPDLGAGKQQRRENLMAFEICPECTALQKREPSSC